MEPEGFFLPPDLVSYWKNGFADARALNLPTVRFSKEMPKTVHTAATLDISQSVPALLQQYSHRERLALLLSAFALLLYRYSDQDDFVIAARVPQHNDPETERMPSWKGTLPLRIGLAGDATVQEVSQRILRLVQAACDTPPASLEQLIEKGQMQVLRHLSIDRVLFVMHWGSTQAIPTRTAARVENPKAHKHDNQLAVTFNESATDISGVLDCSTDLLDDEGARRMANHFINILKGLETPSHRVAQIEMLDATERDEILIKWNETDRGYHGQCIHELFEQQVKKTPNKVALRYRREILTYDGLNARANQLAHYLRKRGAKPEVLVGICFERAINPIVALIAILKTGAAYVPLDPDYPQHRLLEMIQMAQLRIIVTDADSMSRLPPTTTTVVCLDHAASALAAESSENLGSEVAPDNAAYVIYTSGSTGKPKGVIGVQRGVINGLCSVPFDTEAIDEICCLNTSLSFGFSISRLFLPMLCGVPLAIIPSDEGKGADELVDFVESEQITSLACVTSILRQVLGRGQRMTSRLQKLRTVVVGGATLTSDLIRSFERAMPKAKLLNGYGATEIGGAAAVGTMTGKSTEDVTIGTPFANTRIYILDANMNPLPVGVPGELYVEAPHLSRGYLHEPGLTAERFVANPFARMPGGRLFRTGDLGRWLADGEIQYLGRSDDQVKIRGFRIALGEIESTLKGHEQISDVVVTTYDIGDDKRLAAYVVAKAACPSTQALRNYLRERLPDFMVPAAFVVIDRLPMTTTGKIDRASLPPPDRARPELDMDYEVPRNPLETAIVSIWENLLGLEDIGIYDNFLELGGHSLLATQMLSAIRDLTSLEVTLQSFFQNPTIGGLTEILSASDAEGKLARLSQVLGHVAVISEEQAALELERLSKTEELPPTE